MRVSVKSDAVAPSLKDEMDGERLLGIAEHMSWIESYAVSAREAAKRKESGVLGLHLKDLRRELMEAIVLFKACE